MPLTEDERRAKRRRISWYALHGLCEPTAADERKSIKQLQAEGFYCLEGGGWVKPLPKKGAKPANA